MTRQRAWLAAVTAASHACGGGGEFTVITEWLGYLPFGLYTWIEIGSIRVVPEAELPPWDSSDVAALVRDGLLEEIARVVVSDDGHDTRTTYRITEAAVRG